MSARRRRDAYGGHEPGGYRRWAESRAIWEQAVVANERANTARALWQRAHRRAAA